MGYSKTVFVGNLTKDPELRVTQTGKSVCSFSIAVKRRMQDETDFWDCTAWGKTGETISKNFFKGKEILVEGEMQKRSYTDKDGNRRWAVELKVDNFSFVGRKDSDQIPNRSVSYSENTGFSNFAEIDDDDSGLPF